MAVTIEHELDASTFQHALGLGGCVSHSQTILALVRKEGISSTLKRKALGRPLQDLQVFSRAWVSQVGVSRPAKNHHNHRPNLT